MPKKIILNGIIGIDITVDTVSQLLEEIENQQVEIHLNTIGGFIYEGLEIYNVIKRYEGKTVGILGGFVASAGTYIAAAFDETIAQDSTVFMIHNAMSFVAGDYRDFEKEAKELKKINKHIAERYVKKTGKSIDQILEMMAEETYLYGQDIVDEGFADKMQESGEDVQPKEVAISLAQKRTAEVRDSYYKRVAIKTTIEEKKISAQEIVELIDQVEQIPAEGKDEIKSVLNKNLARCENNKNPKERKTMDKDELFKHVKSMLESGEINRDEITQQFGSQKSADALRVVNQIKNLGIDDPVEYIKAVKNQATLDEAFGPKSEANLARDYAEQRMNSGATIEELKSDKIFLGLQKQAADYTSQQNNLEESVDGQDQGQTGAKKRRVFNA